MAKRTEQDMIDLCAKYGHTYVGGYINADHKFDFICSCGMPRKTTVSTLVRSKGCKYCTKPTLQNAITLDMVLELCKASNFKYIDGYVKTSLPFNYVCSCGNKTAGWYHNILRNNKSCKECQIHGKGRFTQVEVENKLHEYGLVLLSEYVDSRTPFSYQCRCGNIHKAVYHTLHKDSICPKCKEFEWRNKFTSYGLEILDYNGAAEITYKCTCNNIITIGGTNWEVSDKSCVNCRIAWNFNPYKEPERPNLRTWKKQVLQRDNFTCQICQYDDNLHVHHIIGYAAQPELAANIDNGITLCVDCHTILHSKYGHNVGLANLKAEAQ